MVLNDMEELLMIPKTEGTVSTSRTFHEQLNIEGGTTGYGVLAALLDSNMSNIDAIAENLGRYIAQKQVKEKYDEQFFDPKVGRFKNFMTRNIYLSQTKKQEMTLERARTGVVSALATEAAIKVSARAAQAWMQHCDKMTIISQLYQLLSSFANADTENSDVVNARIELSKIRNSLPISITDKKKLLEKYRSPVPLEDMTLSALNGENSSAIRENVAYMLYSIYCQKYKDDPRGRDTLMVYYNFLGYHGNYAKELIRENGETYSNITDDQVAFLKMARGMLKNVFVTIPEINVERIVTQADEMAQYDPYSIRRKKVQKVGAAGIMTLGGIFAKRPDIVLQAGSTALSQAQLEGNDNAMEFLANTFKDKGIDLDSFITMKNQSKNITDSANEMI